MPLDLNHFDKISREDSGAPVGLPGPPKAIQYDVNTILCNEAITRCVPRISILTHLRDGNDLAFLEGQITGLMERSVI